MAEAVFVTDLHGRKQLYDSLFAYLRNNPPEILFIGGDLLPASSVVFNHVSGENQDFINSFLRKKALELKSFLGLKYPEMFLIMGNDDPREYESVLIDAGRNNLWTYLHNRRRQFENYQFFGYNYVPPSPYMLKDWERYDVSRYTDIGCISPEEGIRTIPVSEHEKKWTTIKEDLDTLTENASMANAVFLFHSPPYDTALDLADIKDVLIDHVPVDPHIGSIAIRRFIEEKQPLLTLHGHVHESSRLSNRSIQRIGRTTCINGSNEGDRLSVIRIDLDSTDNFEILSF